MMAAESAQTLERGLRLLRVLAEGHRGRTPTELAGELGLSRPVVYRLLTTLQAEGFARRDAGGRVHLGFGVLGLAQAVQPLLRATALPVLRTLAERAGATAHLMIAEGDEGLAVAVVEPSWTDMHVAYREGSRHPLTRGAAGLALLALRSGRSGADGAGEGAGDSAGEASNRGVNDGGDPPLRTSHGQLQEGATGIAVPVTGLSWLEASVGVVSFADLDVRTVGPLVLTAAEDLTAALAQPKPSATRPGR
ncbi:IclR family transcriptional regulator [Sphaerimonospora sp. CA-214678]|uniref:IclR family transcriptional regulator n=1 Tax=Sphaerimonospora sp. CA-214678 TaxID=3240029 RepID=UPI003D8A222C